MSEELGVAFGITAGEEWHALAYPAESWLIDTIDVDNLPSAARAVLAVEHLPGTRSRPDYVQVSWSQSNLGQARLSLLECKGVQHRGSLERPMRKAWAQLQTIRGAGASRAVLPGLASGTVASDLSFNVHALQRLPDAPPQLSPHRLSGRRGPTVEVSVHPDDLLPTAPVDAHDLSAMVGATVRAGWAQRARLGGVPNWQAWVDSSKAEAETFDAVGSPTAAPERDQVTIRGTTFVGVSRLTSAADGSRLRLFLGNDAEIDAALRSMSPEEVLDALNRRRGPSAETVPTDGGFAGLTADGVAFIVEQV